ncbi:MAG TPA: SMP-30/gluconolactonase/LRE family protein [Pseudomonadales bacterium]|nr:SMP-30/gluconolactonase/LRE family protein [Pseudomonadales bacterium]
MAFRTIATGLKFPEGPIAMPDGSVVLVEIARGTLSRVVPNGSVEVIAQLGGGPNGAAIGPDGKCYVCNNGGFKWIERDGRLYPGEQPDDYRGGSIQRVDLATGAIETLYSACDGRPLRGPNDIVFDRTGGFWFTDHGKTRARERDRTGVFYARADGSRIIEAIFPLEGPNGIGLSRDESELYVAETVPGRLWAYKLTAPGQASSERRLLPGIAGFYMYDSLAVDSLGNVCVATLINGGISIVSPAGEPARFVSVPDRLTTNICFGGADLRTAYITASSLGHLLATEWEHPGLPLNFLNR